MALKGVEKALGLIWLCTGYMGSKMYTHDPLRAFCPKLTHFGTGLLHYLACCLSSKTFPGVGWT